MFARFDSSQTQRQINAFYMSCLSSHPLPAYYRESCLDFSAFSSALAVCVSILSKPNLTHRFESHCKNNKFSSKRARFTWIFCQYCLILTFKRLLLLYMEVCEVLYYRLQTKSSKMQTKKGARTFCLTPIYYKSVNATFCVQLYKII